jgi:hypothetical protein
MNLGLQQIHLFRATRLRNRSKRFDTEGIIPLRGFGDKARAAGAGNGRGTGGAAMLRLCSVLRLCSCCDFAALRLCNALRLGNTLRLQRTLSAKTQLVA